MVDLLKKNAEHDKSKINFTLDDFENPHFQREYSNYLLGEVKDHLSFYYSSEHYDVFLKFFEFLDGKNKFNYEEFVDAYVNVVRYLESISSDTPKFMTTANDFLQFLFDLNVICYMEKADDHKPFIHWCFKDRNYANISPKVKTNVEYQIFYGLAKALNVGKEFTREKK
ncbi:hypothetical protein D9M70_529100 [compost metagenome]